MASRKQKEKEPMPSRPGRNPTKTTSKKAQKAVQQEKHVTEPKTKLVIKKRSPISPMEIPKHETPVSPFVDCGSYLLNRQFQDNFEKFITRAKKSGLIGIVVLSPSLELSVKSLELARDYAGFLYTMVGAHPHDSCRQRPKNERELLEQLSFKNDVVAIGPLGFDQKASYVSSLNIQQEWFDFQVLFALEHEFPIVLQEFNAFSILMSNWKRISTQKRPTTPEDLTISPFEAAYDGDVAKLEHWFACQENKEVAISIRDKKHNWSPLIYTAATRGHINVIRWFLQNGGDVNITQAHGSTALHGAAAFGKEEVCQILLNNGANKEQKNKFEELPVDLAKSKGFDSIVTILEADQKLTLEDTVLKKPQRKVAIINFHGSLEELEQCNAEGFYIGISGSVTTYPDEFKSFAKANIPLDKILVHTNAPWATPQNISDQFIRESINEPSNVPSIFEFLSQVFDQPVDQLAKQVLDNTKEFFGFRVVNEK